ncbi:hypothetical protein V499_06030 [Pseudogymnoascus sp. VKM F-103]|uniref:Autophagy-related protein 27 n=1 Tax=Pseudogymnoascus verrucosus TaxID=342668 RepID=A0A1B8GUV4_9PEZI|nr:uncharacterized protein VE01_02878 [Pseudogymnoascus verrucosus]KFY73900.1 hypothetical protein V499_06030 [Pseudogymnoascus sp. VKM F-103]OBT99603.1 hypothetical protein VE01_02878 [Pseudogymnoascus verrucosus]
MAPTAHFLPATTTALLLLLSAALPAHARSGTHTTAPAATLPLYPAFIHLPTPPAVLDATLLSAAPAVTGTSGVFEWSIDCPSDENDDNDACRHLSVFPAQLWHTQNGGWRGKMTGEKGITTVWSCDLSGAEETGGPHCVDVISTKGGKAVTTTAQLGCHDDRQLVPLRISEGAEKFPEGWEGVLMGELNAQYGGGLEETGCARTWTMQSGAPIVTRNVTSTAPVATRATTTSVVGTGTSVVDAVASQTGEGKGVRSGVSGRLAAVGAVAAVWFGAW